MTSVSPRPRSPGHTKGCWLVGIAPVKSFPSSSGPAEQRQQPWYNLQGLPLHSAPDSAILNTHHTLNSRPLYRLFPLPETPFPLSSSLTPSSLPHPPYPSPCTPHTLCGQVNSHSDPKAQLWQPLAREVCVRCLLCAPLREFKVQGEGGKQGGRGPEV